jgi:hypothetical protein
MYRRRMKLAQVPCAVGFSGLAVSALLAFTAACAESPPPLGASKTAKRPLADGERIDCRIDGHAPTGENEEASIYCAHINDGCCGSGVQSWVCNNVKYTNWLLAHCLPQ